MAQKKYPNIGGSLTEFIFNENNTFHETTSRKQLNGRVKILPATPYTSGELHAIPDYLRITMCTDENIINVGVDLFDEGYPIDFNEFYLGKKIAEGNDLQETIVHEAFLKNGKSPCNFFKAVVKIIPKKDPFSGDDHFTERIYKEVQIWNKLNHENITAFYAFKSNNEAFYLFSELCVGGSLLDHINNSKGGLNETHAKDLFVQIVEAIKYMHLDAKVVNRDIKPENILLTAASDRPNEIIVKVCDFGLSTPINESIFDTHIAGSLEYCSPEELCSKFQQYPSTKSDIWSLGVVLYAMVTGTLPFYHKYYPILKSNILTATYTRLSEKKRSKGGFSYSLQLLVDSMITINPMERLDILMVKNSSWVKDK
jgi:serine/threonine protein kinase